jgi:hypothetical protein
VWGSVLRLEKGLSVTVIEPYKFDKFGAWQILHSHVTDVSARWCYSSDVIVMHSVWHHWSQLSQTRARLPHLTALEQTGHGNLGVYGPGLSSTCPLSIRRRCTTCLVCSITDLLCVWWGMKSDIHR